MSIYRRLPLGVNDFKRLRERDYYYVDKTQYIQVMEDTSDFLFFTRPRRFGKSLFVSMLEEYYDIKAQVRYEDEFKGTWIYDNPTSEKGKYQVIKFDFSKVGGGSIDEVSKKFNEYCSTVLESFVNKYAEEYGNDTIERLKKTEYASTKFNIIGEEAARLGYKLYVIVDEYDNFTNNILNEMGNEVYRSITHGMGFYRDFLKLFKAMASRFILIGVSPVTLDDATSGLNSYTNITSDFSFNMALGFSETDVREMIRYYKSVGAITKDEEEIIAEMKPWYDNYCFSELSLDRDPKMFNSDMVLYYLSNLISIGMPPEDMLDPNTKTNYNKIKLLIDLDRIDGDRKGVIRTIAEQGYIYTNLEDSFSAEQMARPEIFPSLLYYYGMLTIGGTRGNRVKLAIPNNNVRVQYYNYIREIYQEENSLDILQLYQIIHDAAYIGEWQPLIEYLTSHYKQDSSIRDTIQGEKHIQGYFLAYLSMSRLFITLPEEEGGKGYCDFLLFGDEKRYPGVKHSYIIELKYLKTTATETEAVQQWEEAIMQLRKYASDETKLRLCGNTTLHLIAVQMKGQELVKLAEID